MAKTKAFAGAALALMLAACGQGGGVMAAIEKAEKEAVAYRAACEKTLNDNIAKGAEQTTASGIKYEVFKKREGDGPRPTPFDEVTVHYEGALLSGKVFDASCPRGEPTSFPLNRVIPGWTEGLQLMRPGEVYKFTIPSDLAYGPQGAGGDIGPNETLVFKVELLSFKTPDGKEEK